MDSDSEEETFPPTEVQYSSNEFEVSEIKAVNIMANNNGNNAGGHRNGSSFKVPFAWDKNAPSFDSEDADDLMTFVDHIGQIFGLAGVTDDQEKKRRLTDYLSVKRKEIWRSLSSYKRGTYDRFLEDVYKIYPEVKSSKIGSLNALVKLCKTYKGIEMTDEGILKRFGVEFYALVKKLMKGKAAITTNSEACRRYLETLEPSFAAALKLMVSNQNILKKQMRGLIPVPGVDVPDQAAGAEDAADDDAAAGNDADNEDPAVPEDSDGDESEVEFLGAPVEERRKEDPIDIKELIKLANQMAEGQQEGTISSISYMAPRGGRDLNSVKIERTEEKIEELGSDIAQLKDAFVLIRNETKSAQDNIMKTLQQALKGPPPHRDTAPHRDIVQAGSASNSYGQDRQFGNPGSSNTRGDTNCFYCGGTEHYSRECTVKQEHINKGWLTVEDGKHKLGDGNYIPREEGRTQAQRVEKYWNKKVVSQNWYAQGNQSSDDLESAMDEIRSLKVRLAQTKNILPQRSQEPQIANTYLANSVAPPVVTPQAGSQDAMQLLNTLLLRGLQASGDNAPVGTYAVTRAGHKQADSDPNF